MMYCIRCIVDDRLNGERRQADARKGKHCTTAHPAQVSAWSLLSCLSFVKRVDATANANDMLRNAALSRHREWAPTSSCCQSD